MSSLFPDRTFIPANPRGRGRGAGTTSTSKRGRKPRAQTLDATSPDIPSNPTTPIQWAQPLATTPTVPSVAAPVTPAADSPVVVVAAPSTSTTATGAQRPLGAMEEEAEAEDELLPAMADDDYSAQLSWQSQSKDNLKSVPLLSF